MSGSESFHQRLARGEPLWFHKPATGKAVEGRYLQRSQFFPGFPGELCVVLNATPETWYGYAQSASHELESNSFYDLPYEAAKLLPAFERSAWPSPGDDDDKAVAMLGKPISASDISKNIARRIPDERDVLRCEWDHEVTFGDGGHAVLCFPIYSRRAVLVEDDRVRLLAALHARPTDVQSSVVKDLLDPNWMPYRIPSRDWKKQRWAKAVAEWKRRNPNTKFRPMDENEADDVRLMDRDAVLDMSSDLRDGDPKAIELEQLRPDVFQIPDLPPRIILRQSYVWVPSRLRIGADDSVRFQEHINCCARTPATEDMYDGFERVFSRMLPMFRSLSVLPPKGSESELQVICKAQTYILQPGQTYKGYWHKEGMNENIVAVGVYYCDIGELAGGAVKFRSAGKVPDSNYSRYCTKPEISVSAEQNSCIVFANSVPHRVRMIENRTDKVQTRTFINFFVVHPRKPLHAVATFITAEELREILSRFVHKLGRHLPRDVLNLIVAQCRPWMWNSSAEAQAFRREARLAMQGTKTNHGGFAYMHYGNCGVQSYVDSRSELSYYELRENETLFHTSSGAASD